MGVLLYMYLSSELEPQGRQRTTEGAWRKFVCRPIPRVTSPQATLSHGEQVWKAVSGWGIIPSQSTVPTGEPPEWANEGALSALIRTSRNCAWSVPWLETSGLRSEQPYALYDFQSTCFVSCRLSPAPPPVLHSSSALYTEGCFHGFNTIFSNSDFL